MLQIQVQMEILTSNRKHEIKKNNYFSIQLLENNQQISSIIFLLGTQISNINHQYYIYFKIILRAEAFIFSCIFLILH